MLTIKKYKQNWNARAEAPVMLVGKGTAWIATAQGRNKERTSNDAALKMRNYTISIESWDLCNVWASPLGPRAAQGLSEVLNLHCSDAVSAGVGVWKGCNLNCGLQSAILPRPGDNRVQNDWLGFCNFTPRERFYGWEQRLCPNVLNWVWWVAVQGSTHLGTG